ncbi:CRISPR-associated helicase Cas3' [Lachnotalea glycerini]|uniref:CRISPR-associated helicase Cas3' n=1 Tax=Lachnotalea glycerini TaxID=1763509 RepID=UPI0038CC0775
MDANHTVFPAHFRMQDNHIQTVEEHLKGVEIKCVSYAQKLNFANTGRLLGILHDMGKYTDEFYVYFYESVSRQKAGEPKLTKTVDHGKHGAMLILERYHKGNTYEKTMAEIVAMIICYHHGGLEDFISNDLKIKLLERCNQIEEGFKEDTQYMKASERFYKRIMEPEELDKLFKNAVNEFKDYVSKYSNTNFCYNLHLLIKFLYSCLIDADRYDTYLFMQNKKEEEDLNINRLWEEFSCRLEAKENEFQNKKTNSELEQTIQLLRQDIWKQCNDFGSQPQGIYTLTVPTGGGKTLSSLRYALNHARSCKKSRILYVLPFTSIIEQNAQVVRDALLPKDYLLEHHSNVVDGEDTEKDEVEYRQLLTEQWTSPIIFTTMVQFLNTFFSKGTKNIRRMHNLTDTIIIFDEIQAIPVKCISLFNDAINFLSSVCRDTIILCSATQPGLNKVEHKMQIKEEIILDLREKFADFKRMEIIDKRYKKKMSLFELGEFVKDVKKDNQSILIILNTKEIAKAVFQEVKKNLDDTNIIFYFLNTNLCPAHRKDGIKKMKEALNNHKQVICVSTQLIEAGVDISFSCVIRHIAGLDSIAQASGRGNRNGEGEIKKTYIIELEGEELGSLKYIEIGEKAASYVLDDYRRKADKYDYNLLSPFAIQHYYMHFYRDDRIEKNMDYPVSKTTIYQMLSNPNKRNAYEKVTNQKCPLMLEFQFKQVWIEILFVIIFTLHFYSHFPCGSVD